jgi:hypothetical protein
MEHIFTDEYFMKKALQDLRPNKREDGPVLERSERTPERQ